MVTKQKLQLGGLLMAFMIVHAAKKEGERERERSEHVSVGHLQEVKHNGKL